MKRIIKIAMALSIFGFALLLCFSEGAYTGVVPNGVQGAFFTKDFKCIYVKGSDELSGPTVVNKWQTYTADVTKNIGYDGMGGSRKGYTIVRIKVNTKSPNQEVVLYIDNVVLKDPAGNVILSFNFTDGESHGPYLSQGKEKPDNGKVMDLNGEKCFLLHANSVNLYGYNGVETQWLLPKNPKIANGSWDFSAGGYVLSFSYYVAAAN